jgi:peptide/nickel transport system permease protein
LLTFALLAAAGGDALTALADDPLASEATVEQMRQVYGLDQPFAARYWRWLSGAARGDLGESFFYHAPVSSLVLPRLLNTMMLGLAALGFAWAISLALGLSAARRPRGWIDRASDLLITLTASTPRIVVALALLAFASGTSLMTHLSVALPAFALSVPLVALFLAQVREGVGEALGEDFVRTARAKGLSERTILLRHALRPSLTPLITIMGYSLGSVMSGSVIVETVLNWPGLGSLSVNAVRSRDVPLLMGVVLATAMAVFIGNLIADILISLNDPRLRETNASTV